MSDTALMAVSSTHFSQDAMNEPQKGIDGPPLSVRQMRITIDQDNRITVVELRIMTVLNVAIEVEAAQNGVRYKGTIVLRITHKLAFMETAEGHHNIFKEITEGLLTVITESTHTKMIHMLRTMAMDMQATEQDPAVYQAHIRASTVSRFRDLSQPFD